MIGNLTGKVKKKSRNFLIIDVNGVGYKVFVPLNVLSKSEENSDVSLFTHLHVREDILALYGFEEEKQLDLFETLINISGIGPRIALGVLSSVTVEQIEHAVATGDLSTLLTVPGVGKKNAQRIIVELQTKLGKLAPLDFSKMEAQKEVIEALKSLGYTIKEAREALREVDNKLPTEVQVKEALRRLSIK